MNRAAFDVVRGQKSTARTEDSTFTITALDVGTQAVRRGCMAVVEEERNVLLAAAKVALHRLQSRKPADMDGVAEFALEAAVKMAEAPR